MLWFVGFRIQMMEHETISRCFHMPICEVFHLGCAHQAGVLKWPFWTSESAHSSRSFDDRNATVFRICNPSSASWCSYPKFWKPVLQFVLYGKCTSSGLFWNSHFRSPKRLNFHGNLRLWMQMFVGFEMQMLHHKALVWSFHMPFWKVFHLVSAHQVTSLETKIWSLQKGSSYTVC